MHIKKLLLTGAIPVLLALGGVAAGTSTASAYIACNRDGDCWHTESRYHRVPGVSFQYHPDDYYFHNNWGQDHQRHWRDSHEGRGYWRGGVWVTL